MKNTVKMLRSNTSGFTFVELLVVIVIMAVLIAASANYLFSTGGAKSRDVERKNEMKQMAALITEFVSSYGSPPNAKLPVTVPRIKRGLSDPSKCKITNDQASYDNLIDCMVIAGSIGGDGAEKLKYDPKEGVSNDTSILFDYRYAASENAWKLCALLENQKDPDINDDGDGDATITAGKGMYCLVTQNRELSDVTISY